VILTVTLNAALDVTYRVPRLVPHASHRVSEVAQVAGGKGVNVASVLALQGVPVLATGLLGGVTGEQVGADLDTRGIRHDFAPCRGESRRAVAVVSEADGDATVFNEPGPRVSAGEWEAFLAHLGALVERQAAAVVVASGSLPPGLPLDAHAQVVQVVRAGGARSIVDASGDALTGAVTAGPDLVKPNRDELREVTGEADPVAGAGVLQRRGARDVVVSAGPDGLVLVDREGGVTRASLAEPLRGNPTGAGDAVVAALAAGLASGAPPAKALAEAVAWSAAAVLHPLAGQVRRVDVDRLRPLVRIEQGGTLHRGAPEDHSRETAGGRPC
jgi:1-phosphofructokinase family hexose kinase